MRSLPMPVQPAATSRQLSMPFEPGRLQGMCAADRQAALRRLTRLLEEATGVVEERDDDGR